MPQASSLSKSYGRPRASGHSRLAEGLTPRHNMSVAIHCCTTSSPDHSIDSLRRQIRCSETDVKRVICLCLPVHLSTEYLSTYTPDPLIASGTGYPLFLHSPNPSLRPIYPSPGAGVSEMCKRRIASDGIGNPSKKPPNCCWLTACALSATNDICKCQSPRCPPAEERLPFVPCFAANSVYRLGSLILVVHSTPNFLSQEANNAPTYIEP